VETTPRRGVVSTNPKFYKWFRTAICNI